MEAQTRFDLKTAIEEWRHELAMQPNSGTESRRELETHLRDSCAELCRLGLRDEEAFWLARRRLGWTEETPAESTATTPVGVWSERVFWIAVALLGVLLWRHACSCFATLMPHFAEMLQWRAGRAVFASTLIFSLLACWLPLLYIPVVLAGGRLSYWGRWMLEPLFRSRLRFLLATVALILVISAAEACLIAFGAAGAGIPPSLRSRVVALFLFRMWALCLTTAVIAAWLLPGRDAARRLARNPRSCFRRHVSAAGPGKPPEAAFDLDAAVQKWRNEFAAHPDLTAEIRRELETHLRDSIVQLQRLGLKAEEAFLVARRRVGEPHELSAEFARADVGRVWRQRLFWIAAALLAMNLWQSIWFGLWQRAIGRLASGIEQSWLMVYLPIWTSGLIDRLTMWLRDPWLCNLAMVVPAAWLAVRLARGRVARRARALDFVVRSRVRIVVAGAALVLGFACLQTSFLWGWHGLFPSWMAILENTAWLLSLVFLMAWFTPDRDNELRAAHG